jgi:ABC-type multidrug transport system ATPase subunit
MTYNIIASIEISINNIKKVLLNEAKLNLNKKELVFLRSKNGSGKTTFVKSLVGFQATPEFKKKTFLNLLSKKSVDVNKVSSRISFKYEKEERNSMWIAKNTSYMSQDFPYFMKNLTILDFILDKIEGSVDEAKLASLKKNKEFILNIENLLNYFFYNKDFNFRKFNLNSKILKMSGGELQVISLVATIVRGIFAKILILDEPFNNLGDKEKRKASDLITNLWDQKDELLIIVVSHCNILDINYFYNRKILEISEATLDFEETKSDSFSCIGQPSNGYYNKDELFFNNINLKEKTYA